MKKTNTKTIIIIILCLAIVVSFWIITLKLNLQKNPDNTSRSGLTFEELINEVNQIVEKSPLSKPSEIKSENSENNLEEFKEKVAGEVNKEIEKQKVEGAKDFKPATLPVLE